MLKIGKNLILEAKTKDVFICFYHRSPPASRRDFEASPSPEGKRERHRVPFQSICFDPCPFHHSFLDFRHVLGVHSSAEGNWSANCLGWNPGRERRIGSLKLRRTWQTRADRGQHQIRSPDPANWTCAAADLVTARWWSTWLLQVSLREWGAWQFLSASRYWSVWHVRTWGNGLVTKMWQNLAWQEKINERSGGKKPHKWRGRKKKIAGVSEPFWAIKVICLETFDGRWRKAHCEACKFSGGFGLVVVTWKGVKPARYQPALHGTVPTCMLLRSYKGTELKTPGFLCCKDSPIQQNRPNLLRIATRHLLHKNIAWGKG